MDAKYPNPSGSSRTHSSLPPLGLAHVRETRVTTMIEMLAKPVATPSTVKWEIFRATIMQLVLTFWTAKAIRIEVFSVTV
jgi:hypothetical protein